MKTAYLDHHSTTPLDPRVLDAMMPYFEAKFGNASSTDHRYGSEAAGAVEESRKKIAGAIGAQSSEIIFTSGATESDNLALLGVMSRYAERGNHLITCATEHHAILDAARHLEGMGKKVTYLPVDRFGEINADDVRDAITNDTVLISVMAANNEIGTLHPIKEIGQIAHENGVLFHSDAAQAAGHIPIDVNTINIDLMSISAHKMYGPKGIGALYVRGTDPMVRLDPIIHGGGQERNVRSGTLNVPAIAGFGRAIEIAVREMGKENERFRKWSKTMQEEFARAGGRLNGHPSSRLPANLNVCFPGVDGKAVINSVSETIAISAGSACTAESVEPSHVLLALGLGEEDAHSSIRIGMGRFNTVDEINHCTSEISKSVSSLRNLSGYARHEEVSQNA